MAKILSFEEERKNKSHLEEQEVKWTKEIYNMISEVNK